MIEARPGMSLAADVVDARGHLLLAKGTTLRAEHLDTLRRKGIEQVCIEATEPADAARLDARREHVHARLTHLFRRVAADPVMQQLQSLLMEYRMEQCTEVADDGSPGGQGSPQGGGVP